jgi:hypothetical protein
MAMSKKPQGFAHLKKYDPERQKEIASQGGRTSQDKKAGHRWTRQEAVKHAPAGGHAKAKNQKGKG